MNLGFIISDSILGEVVIRPDYSNLKFQVTNNDGRAVFTVSGSITLFGADYDTYASVGTDYEIQCFQKGSEFFTAPKNNIEIVSKNVSLKHIELSLKAETEYLQPGWNNYDKEYNINEFQAETNTLYFEPQYIQVKTRTPASITYNGHYAITLPNLSAFAIANWDIDWMRTEYSGIWDGTYETVIVYYKRQQAYGYYIDAVRYDPDGVTPAGASWQYIEDLVLDDRTLPLFKKVITPIYTPNPAVQPYVDIHNTANYFNKPPIYYTGIHREVIDVFKFLFLKMGLASYTNFDNSGTATDSFYSFKSMIGEDIYKDAGHSTLMYQKLVVCNLTDFVPADDNAQKDVKASETWVSFKTLIEFFERRGFFWYLENRSGTYYFKLEHKSQKSLGTGNPDLKNYYNFNFEKYAEKYDREAPEFNRVRNLNEGKSFDFIGTDLVYSNIDSVDAVKDFQDERVFVDLNDIANRRHDVYSETDNNNICIIATFPYSVWDYVRDATGKRTLNPCNNSELSWSFVAEELYCDLEDVEINVNGADVTADDYRRKRRNKYKTTIPIDDIKTDFDITDYIVLFGQNCEFESLSQNSKDTVGELIMKS